MSRSRRRSEQLNPVLDAVRTRHVDELVSAVANGADPNAQDRDGRTPLMEAVLMDLLDMVEALLRMGANVKVQDKNGWTALHFAAQDYRVEIARLLLKNGADVDAQDTNGNTSLSNAVFNSQGRGDMIRTLVEAGADQILANQYGISPRDLALSIANYKVAQFLE